MRWTSPNLHPGTDLDTSFRTALRTAAHPIRSRLRNEHGRRDTRRTHIDTNDRPFTCELRRSANGESAGQTRFLGPPCIWRRRGLQLSGESMSSNGESSVMLRLIRVTASRMLLRI